MGFVRSMIFMVAPLIEVDTGSQRWCANAFLHGPAGQIYDSPAGLYFFKHFFQNGSKNLLLFIG